MQDNLMFTIVRVHVELLNINQDMFFSFTYMKDTQVEHFDPPNMYFAPDQEARDLIIHG